MRSLPFAALLTLAAGCSRPVPLYCDEDTPCEDPALPFCDLNGQYPESDFIGKTCIPYPWDAGVPDAAPVSCGDPGATLRCDAGQLVTCGDDGYEDHADCPLGCHAEDVRCNDVAPSNGLAEYLDAAAAAPAVDLTGGATIDTLTGEIRDARGALIPVPSFLVPAPPNGVPIRVFAVSAWRSGSLRIQGGPAGTPALAIVSDDDLRVAGIGFGRDPKTAGELPATDPCTGGNGSIKVENEHPQISGSGGAGNNGPGGDGGYVNNVVALAGEAGLGFSNADLVPLRGGCEGGGPGGGGGGAVQLVSGTSIIIEGNVGVPGSGGYEGTQDPPGGGGSGGGILLEAPVVALSQGSGLFANGGGGACLAGSAGAGDGSDGPYSTASAVGGTCSPPQYANGGNGGSNQPARDGFSTTLTTSQPRAGGAGGGAAGYIRINTADGTFASTSSTVVSPTPSTATLEVR